MFTARGDVPSLLLLSVHFRQSINQNKFVIDYKFCLNSSNVKEQSVV